MRRTFPNLVRLLVVLAIVCVSVAVATVAAGQAAGIDLWTSSGPVHSSVLVNATGFNPNAQLTAKFDGFTISTLPSTVTANSNGDATFAVWIPTATNGLHLITVTDGTNTAPSTTTPNFTVQAQVVITSPNSKSGPYGTSVTVAGTGFSGGGVSATVTMGGQTLAVVPLVDSIGSFTATGTVPLIPSGAATVTATDSAGVTAAVTDQFNVTQKVVLSPDTGDVGTYVSIVGYGFTANGSVPVGGITFGGKPWNTNVVTISSSGVFLFVFLAVPSDVTLGSNPVVVTDNDSKQASANFEVTLTPSSYANYIAVTPANAAIAVSGTQQFTATLYWSDTTSEDVTPGAIWDSSHPGVAETSLSQPGVVTGKSVGTASITAQSYGKTGAASITVGNALISVEIRPPGPYYVGVGGMVQLRAFAHYTYGSDVDITSQAAWTSTDNNVATVGDQGFAKGVVTGVHANSPCYITASFGGMRYSVRCGVTGLYSLRINPTDAYIAIDETRLFTVTGIYQGGGTADVSLEAEGTWATLWGGGAVTITDTGQATGHSVGGAIIFAKVEGIPGSTTLTVVGPTPTLGPSPNPTGTPISTPTPTPNTPTGTIVFVPLSGAVVTFSSVSGEGQTAVTTSQSNTCGTLPSGFQVRGQFTDISTTATYTSPVAVGISYAPSGITDEPNLRLYHCEGGQWVDVTESVDTVNHFVYGKVSSLSTFFIGDPSEVGGGAGVPVVFIDPQSQSVDAGQTFTLNIAVRPQGKGVSAVQVIMRFDASAMYVGGVELGDLLGADAIPVPGYPKIDNTGGTVQIAAARQGATTPPTAEGVFAKITLTAAHAFPQEFPPGTYLFTLEKAQVVDENALDISGVINEGGSVTINTAKELLPGGGLGHKVTLGRVLPPGNITPGPGETPQPVECPRWDINADGVVNSLDLSALGQDYGQPPVHFPRSDINEDGVTELKDHSLLAAHMGDWLECGNTPTRVTLIDRSAQPWTDWTGSLYTAGTLKLVLPGPTPKPPA